MPRAGGSARARARKGLPVERYALGKEPSDDLTATTTLDERIAMMRPLALAAWAVAGRPLPDHGRRRAPGRLLRRHRRPKTPTRGPAQAT